MELKTGTTIVGIVSKDGIILASDKRATMGYLVASRDVEKIIQVSDNIVIAAAGMVSDLQFLAKILSANIKLKELRSNRKVTVKEATSFLSVLMYSRRLVPYYVYVIVAGKDLNGYKIYSLDPAGSIIEEKDYVATGSGMTFALGVLETEYKKDITLEEAKKLAIKAVYSAMQRDVGSGDGIEIVTITDSGIQREIITPEEAKKVVAQAK